jgi:glycosyltransferase involved in cell wall biosynthesis
MKPVVSFIIPCLNSEQTLAPTLESILAQDTEVSFEVIVADNGSVDGTVALAQKFPVRTEHCRKRGAGAARNFGAQVAQGEYLAFIDSDVILARDWLELLIHKMRSHGFHVGLGKVIPAGDKSFFNDFRLALNRSRYAKTAISLFDLQGNVNPVVNTAACIYRKVFFRALGGFDERLSRLEDTEMSVRSFVHGSPFYATRHAESWVYNTGTLWGYLIRSRKLGRARRELHQVSQAGTPLSPGRVYSFEVLKMHKEFRGFRQHGFYYLNILFNLIGFLQSFSAPPLSPQPIKPQLTAKALQSFQFELGSESYQLTPRSRLIVVDQDWYFYYPGIATHYRLCITDSESIAQHVSHLLAQDVIRKSSMLASGA